ncbi:Eukaryotic translation initiation factor 3 subunit A [Bienertia sinuspersici]
MTYLPTYREAPSMTQDNEGHIITLEILATKIDKQQPQNEYNDGPLVEDHENEKLTSNNDRALGSLIGQFILEQLENTAVVLKALANNSSQDKPKRRMDRPHSPIGRMRRLTEKGKEMEKRIDQREYEEDEWDFKELDTQDEAQLQGS